MTLEVVTPSTITAFLLQEVKDHLRVTHPDDDAYIQGLIFAVGEIAEIITRRTILAKTYKLHLDGFSGREICIPKPPLQSITHIKYYDTAGVLQTIDSSLYQVDIKSEPGRVCLWDLGTWPSTESGRLNSVEIQFVAGYTNRYAVPEPLRQAMLYHISHMYDNRESAVVGATVNVIPYALEFLYWPYRVMRFF